VQASVVRQARMKKRRRKKMKKWLRKKTT